MILQNNVINNIRIGTSMPKSYYMKNWLWLLKPYIRYAKKYFVFSLVFFGILVPFLNFCDVIFPEFIISSIDTKSPAVKIMLK